MLNPQTVDELIRALAEVARSRVVPAPLAEHAADAMREIDELSSPKAAAGVVFDVRTKSAPETARPAIRTYGNGTAATAPSRSEPCSGTLDGSIVLEGEIVFEVMDYANGSDIFRMRLPSTETRPLLKRNVSDKCPTWAPDGTRIALCSSGKSSFDIFLFDPYNDRPPRKLVSLAPTPVNESWPTWSPDGQRLAFEISDRVPLGIWVMDVNAPEEVTVLTEDGRQPAWSPDGERIMFVRKPSANGGPSILSANPDGSDERVIFYDDHPSTATQAPRWSRDGSKILATRATSMDKRVLITELLIINPQSGSARVLDLPCEHMLGLAWSPDGRFVLACSVSTASAAQPTTLHAISVTDGRHRVLAEMPEFIQSASWKGAETTQR